MEFDGRDGGVTGDKTATISRISRVQPSAGTEFLPLVPPMCPHTRTADATWQTYLLDDLGFAGSPEFHSGYKWR